MSRPPNARYPVSLTPADLEVIGGAMIIWHAVLGCKGCQPRATELMEGWAALGGAELDEAREHATDLALRLGAVMAEHSPGGAS